MSATDVGWAPPGGVKDNKEENDALACLESVAIATRFDLIILSQQGKGCGEATA